MDSRCEPRFRVQLWALGRANGGQQSHIPIVAPSPIPIATVPQPGTDKTVVPTPKEMTVEDIQRYMKSYKTAAENAKMAGFDGVELHGANGYLIDQVCVLSAIDIWSPLLTPRRSSSSLKPSRTSEPTIGVVQWRTAFDLVLVPSKLPSPSLDQKRSAFGFHRGVDSRTCSRM